MRAGTLLLRLLVAIGVIGAGVVVGAGGVIAAGAPGMALAQAIRIDGIAAVVNEEIISIGEVRRAAAVVRESALWSAAGACATLTGDTTATPDAGHATADSPGSEHDALAAALECLIDRTLVFREVRRFPQLDVPSATIEAAVQQIADTFSSPAAWQAELQRVGLTPQSVRADLRRQMLIANYIDSRFRATVEISNERARQFFGDELAPDMRERGISVPSFESVAEEFVIPILREREVNRRVQSWIVDLRGRASIRRSFP